MDVDPELISYGISLILALLSIVFGDKYVKYKQKFADAEKVTVKISAALKATSDAVTDDNITPDEEQAIVEHWKGVIAEAKHILK